MKDFNSARSAPPFDRSVKRRPVRPRTGKWITLLLFCTVALNSRGIQTDTGERPVSSQQRANKALRFMVLGDWGAGTRAQKKVAAAMAVKKESDGADFVIGTGDNFYPSGVSSVEDRQWRTKFEEMYDSVRLAIPFYHTLGNHDYGSDVESQIDYTRRSRRWSMPSRYYTFSRTLEADTIPVAQFFALDTQGLIGREKSAEAQLRWLDSSLQESRAHWKFVYGHHTIFSNGAHGGTPRLHTRLKPLLEKNGVDVYFCGHDHNLEVLKPVNGVRYVVSGGGGAWIRKVRKQRNSLFVQSTWGFIWCAVSRSRLLVQCVDADGSLLFEISARKR